MRQEDLDIAEQDKKQLDDVLRRMLSTPPPKQEPKKHKLPLQFN